MKILVLSLPLLAGLTLSAPAAVLPVGNASFESPALAAGAYTFDFGSSWVRAAGNGTLLHTHSSVVVDGRMSLEATALFFADNNSENAPLYVGAIAMWNGPLSAADIAALGGPAAPFRRTGRSLRPCPQRTLSPADLNFP